VGDSPERWNPKIVKSRKPKSPPKKNSSLGHLYFSYDQNSECAIVDEPEEYVRPVSGYVEFLIEDGHDDVHEGKLERGTVAGRFDASYINVENSLVNGVKLYGVMDTYSAETAEIYETLFDPHTDELRKDVKELLGDVTFRNILVINRVEILPAYRGMGLGLATMWNIIHRHSAGCGIVALKAFPFQFRAGGWSGRLRDLEESDWNKKMGYDPYSYTMEFAHEKLIFHLMKLGFKRIGDRGVVALSTSMQYPIPQEILRWVHRSVLPEPEQR
jgi:hypothetical protein